VALGVAGGALGASHGCHSGTDGAPDRTLSRSPEFGRRKGIGRMQLASLTVVPGGNISQAPRFWSGPAYDSRCLTLPGASRQRTRFGLASPCPWMVSFLPKRIPTAATRVCRVHE
jgi:hypothetical protein